MKKPNNLVIDLRSVREAAQAYVILSRVQALDQLFILVSVCASQITASIKAMEELEQMIRRSDKSKIDKRKAIISCNIRSINKNFKNFATATATVTKQTEVLCLQETWLDPLVTGINLLENEGLQQHNNSVGKGISTFYKQNFVWVKDVTKEYYQITKIQSEVMDIINLYRSAAAKNVNFLDDLCGLITSRKQTLILGDFNICYINESSNQVFQILKSKKFQQLVKCPTHIEGRMIDLVFYFCQDASTCYEVQQQAQYYTDHDLI